MKKILYIENDNNVATVIRDILEAKNFEVSYRADETELLTIMDADTPDFLLLNFPQVRRNVLLKLVQQIRLKHLTPIILFIDKFISDDTQLNDSVKNINFICKPYSYNELIVRMNQLMQHETQLHEFVLGDITFIPCEHLLKLTDGSVQLTKTESDVLKMLCENKGQFVSRSDIAVQVWNVSDPKLKERSLNNILYKLRKYLDKNQHIEIASRNGLGLRIMTM